MSLQPLNAGLSLLGSLIRGFGSDQVNGAGLLLSALESGNGNAKSTGVGFGQSGVLERLNSQLGQTASQTSQGNSTGEFPPKSQSSNQTVQPTGTVNSASLPAAAITGINTQQIANFQTESFASGASQVFNGQILQSASAAAVSLQGTTNGSVLSNATFQLTGSLGTADISIQQGETLADVASRINAISSSTGVQAQVDTNQLIFQSTNVGSSANVSVKQIGSSKSTVTSGVNAQQLSSFQVGSLTSGASVTLSGTVNQLATAASVALQGSTSGTVINSATFQLSGSVGSTSVSIQQGESLFDVANSINASTNSTGVRAQVESNQLIFQSTGIGSAAKVSVQLTNVAHTNVVSGVSADQLSNFQANTFTTGASETLSGTVTQSASAASVALQGSTNNTVIDSATFQLTGSLGSASVSIQQGESLSDVATSVNSLTSSTGVQAQVVNNQVVFQSTNVGSAASVDVQLTDITHTNDVSGVNSQQLSSFQVNSFTTGASETLNGTVTQSASAASVALQGSANSTVLDSATFQLTGTHGSSSVSITQGESLADVAANVNALTSSTGVQAQVVSNQVVFQSTNVGSSANVGVQLTNITHTNDVSGVNTQQLTSFQVNEFTTGASETLSGTVTQSASAASVALQGSTSSTVIDSATFKLTGSLGSSSVSITQGESLSAVAASVNALTSSTGVQAQVVSNQVVFQSTNVGSAASVAVQLTNITHTNVVTGANAQQLTNFQVNAFTIGASETLNGTVTQSASAAAVALQGSTSSTVIDSATFQLSGSLGSASVSITQGESLANVATSVNALTSSTGVQAQVVSNQVVFQSTNLGSAASVAVQLTNITHTNVVTGVNAQQLTNFQVNSFTTGASESLNGTVTQTAGIGQLSFAGTLGFVGTSSTFTLHGSLGSTQITTTGLESLSSVASQVNSSTASTGIKAVVSGSTLQFQTVGVGSSATIGVTVTSGSFNVTGGNGNGTANGTNAKATLNGQSLTGNGNSFSFSDALGSYSFNAVAGFTGAISAVNITSQAGQFNVTGGNGNGTANGTNAKATLNGQSLTGNGNSFSFSDALGSYSFNAVAGFTGAINAVNITSQAGQFNVTGGNGNGTANGADAKATVNGQNLTGTGNAFHFSDALGTYSFNTAAGFTGAFNAVNITSQAGQFNVTGGNGNGTANGTDAKATVNGQNLTGNGNSFIFSDSLGSYSFNTAAGFTGAINAVNITSHAGQFDVTGGNGNGSANGTNAEATVNGQNLTGNGNSFNFSDALGTYSFNTASGFTGAISAINITSQAGQFNVTGGNGNGAATGTDAKVTVNGQSLTGKGNAFTYSNALGTFLFSTAAGFTGAFDSVNVSSQTGQFNVSGGNGNGTANGIDAKAVINGLNLTGNGNAFTFSDALGTYSFNSATGFTGEFDPITVTQPTQNSQTNSDSSDSTSQLVNDNISPSVASVPSTNFNAMIFIQNEIDQKRILDALSQLPISYSDSSTVSSSISALQQATTDSQAGQQQSDLSPQNVKPAKYSSFLQPEQKGTTQLGSQVNHNA